MREHRADMPDRERLNLSHGKTYLFDNDLFVKWHFNGNTQ
ncbi:hypothetical protein HMPREF0653_02046 [Prevotella disiens JCM 6334 = ATCC 29426]|uniref:Uncharacterized protein n=1 Tax=Prevotella disiens JCM 6334 = ATCC 29426 TaxID=1235811 RepID=A0ABN0NQC6_9BACT|nr:hypothetical protein HMPREF0653_02046 [Prevotella disiens JCM 6334 = ATCC 29426]